MVYRKKNQGLGRQSIFLRSESGVVTLEGIIWLLSLFLSLGILHQVLEREHTQYLMLLKKVKPFEKKCLVLFLFMSNLILGAVANSVNERKAEERFFNTHLPSESLIRNLLKSRQYKQCVIPNDQNLTKPGLYENSELNWIISITEKEGECFTYLEDLPLGEWKLVGSGWTGLQLLSDALDQKVFPEIKIIKPLIKKRKFKKPDPREIIF